MTAPSSTASSKTSCCKVQGWLHCGASRDMRLPARLRRARADAPPAACPRPAHRRRPHRHWRGRPVDLRAPLQVRRAPAAAAAGSGYAVGAGGTTTLAVHTHTARPRAPPSASGTSSTLASGSATAAWWRAPTRCGAPPCAAVLACRCSARPLMRAPQPVPVASHATAPRPCPVLTCLVPLSPPPPRHTHPPIAEQARHQRLPVLHLPGPRRPLQPAVHHLWQGHGCAPGLGEWPRAGG